MNNSQRHTCFFAQLTAAVPPEIRQEIDLFQTVLRN